MAFLDRAFDLLSVIVSDYQHRSTTSTNSIISTAAPTTTVLDIGSGSGMPLAHKAVVRGHALHGIDLSPNMVRLAQRQVVEGRFECVDVLHYAPDPPGFEFDAVFAMFSLFLERGTMSDLMRRMGGWIKPRGWLFVGTMLAEDFEAKVSSASASASLEEGKKEQKEDADDEQLGARSFEHGFMGRRITNLLYTRAGWTRLLEDAGFEIIFTEKRDFKPPPQAGCDLEPHFYIAARRRREGCGRV